jgi:hypothetical protein
LTGQSPQQAVVPMEEEEEEEVYYIAIHTIKLCIIDITQQG